MKLSRSDLILKNLPDLALKLLNDFLSLYSLHSGEGLYIKFVSCGW